MTLSPASAGRRALLLAVWIVVCVALFVLIAAGSRSDAGLLFDLPTLLWFGEHQSVAATRVALTLDLLGISYLLMPASVVVALALSEAGRARAGLFLIACVFGAVGINLAAKAYFARARPGLLDPLTPVTNASFPSGHAMGSLAFAAGLALILLRLVPRHRGSTCVLLAAFAIGVGVSRIYLQVHYPSDVLAAWALSAAWIAAMMLWYPPPVPTSSVPASADRAHDAVRFGRRAHRDVDRQRHDADVPRTRVRDRAEAVQIGTARLVERQVRRGIRVQCAPAPARAHATVISARLVRASRRSRATLACVAAANAVDRACRSVHDPRGS